MLIVPVEWGAQRGGGQASWACQLHLKSSLAGRPLSYLDDKAVVGSGEDGGIIVHVRHVDGDRRAAGFGRIPAVGGQHGQRVLRYLIYK